MQQDNLIQNEIDIFKKRFSEIEKALSTSDILKVADESFENGLKAYEITASEKSLAYAEYKSKITSQLISSSIDTALKLGVAMAQEISAKDNVYLDEALKQEQVAKVIAEKNMIKSQDKLVSAQQNAERVRLETTKAENEIKNLQTLLTFTQLMQEMTRTKVLSNTAEQNYKIKQAELFCSWYKTAVDKNQTTILGSNIHEFILKEIDKLKDDENYQDTNKKLDEIIKDLQMPGKFALSDELLNSNYELRPSFTLFISDMAPLVGDNVKISVIADEVFEHDVKIIINESEIINATSVVKSFTQSGEVKIKAIVKKNQGDEILEFCKSKIVCVRQN